MAMEKSGGGGVASSSSVASTMDRFLKIVVSWDYFRIVADAKGCDRTKGLQRVKNSYASMAEYLGVFKLLLFEENAHIARGHIRDKDDWSGLAKRGDGIMYRVRVVPEGASGVAVPTFPLKK